MKLNNVCSKINKILSLYLQLVEMYQSPHHWSRMKLGTQHCWWPPPSCYSELLLSGSGLSKCERWLSCQIFLSSHFLQLQHIIKHKVMSCQTIHALWWQGQIIRELRDCVQIPLELTGVFLGSGSLIQFINLQFVVVDARFLVHIAKTHWQLVQVRLQTKGNKNLKEWRITIWCVHSLEQNQLTYNLYHKRTFNVL